MSVLSGGAMIRYIYSSSLAKDQTPQQITAYLDGAREYNLAHRLSGLIVQMERNLLSVREGPEQVVCQYLDWLQTQPACRSLIVLARHQIEQPMFACLQLGYIEAQLGMDLKHPTQTILAQVLSLTPEDEDQRYTLQVINDFLRGKWHHRPIAYNQSKVIRR
jgi:hypothetical protein